MTVTGLPPHLSPTQFAVETSGLIPAPTHAHDGPACACARCGAAIATGDPVHEHLLGANFTDHLALASNAPVVCHGCATLTQTHAKRVHARVIAAVITRDGWYRAGKHTEMAYWLLNPPEAPFVIHCQTAKGQHTLWRSRVNLVRSPFFIQIGARTELVRQETLSHLVDLLLPWQVKTKAKMPMRFDPSRTPIHASHMMLTQQAQGTEIGHALLQATYGEVWALARIIFAGTNKGKLPKFEQPDPFPRPLFDT
ncbi:MAG: hypothetical protein RJQ08_12200 [Salinisphaeraceae bacterium]